MWYHVHEIRSGLVYCLDIHPGAARLRSEEYR
jgi:hypothetical protein